MSRKKLLIIISATIIILIILVMVFLYITKSNEAQSAGRTFSFKELFSFGDSSGNTNGSNSSGSSSQTSNGVGGTTDTNTGDTGTSTNSGYKEFNSLDPNNIGADTANSGVEGGGTQNNQSENNTSKSTDKTITQKIAELWTEFIDIFDGTDSGSEGTGSGGSGNTRGNSGGGFSFKQFLPFGGDNTDNTPVTSATTTTKTNGEQTDIDPSLDPNYDQKLRKLSTEPVAGIGTFDTTEGTTVRFIERATGHVYEAEMFSARLDRISNTTIPTIYKAVWGDSAKTYIAQYVRDDDSTVSSYSMTVGAKTKGVVLDTDILDVTTHGSNLFYLKKNGSGSIGVVSKMDGSGKKQVWSSPLQEVLAQYVSSKTVSLVTKPYQNVNGYMYNVNTNTGKVTKILGPVAGLSAIESIDEKNVFFLSQVTGAQLYIYNIANRTSNQIGPVTFPEKCAWSKKESTIVYCGVPRELLTATSLTDWYKGYTAHTDDIWKYDISDNSSTLIGNLVDETGEAIDVTQPIVSDNGQYLIFINKRDGVPWTLDLTK